MSLCVYVHVCSCACAHARACACVCVCVCVRTHSCLSVCLFVCVCVCLHVCMHVHVTHKHIYLSAHENTSIKASVCLIHASVSNSSSCLTTHACLSES